MQSQVGSWGLKCLGSRIGFFFMRSLEVSEGKKRVTQPQCLQELQ
jgi:hypothetical protein